MNGKDSSKNNFNFIIAIILLVIAIGNLIFNLNSCKNFHIISAILGFIPFILVLVRYVLSFMSMNANFKVINFRTLGLIIFCFVVNIIAINALEYVTSTTNPLSYQKVLKSEKYPRNEYIAHFPREIPKEAENIIFKEWSSLEEKPGMILKYYISKEKYEESNFEEEMKNAKYIANSKSDIEDINEKYFVPDLVYDRLEMNDEDKDESEDFQIYFIDCSPIEEWNHGYSYGLIANNEEYSITYFKVKW